MWKTQPGYHNYVLKIHDDAVKYSYVGLACAISAKNLLINHDGFSPSQIVFGRGRNLPNIMNDSLPALETKTNSADLPPIKAL